jgi:hypothetical protein
MTTKCVDVRQLFSESSSYGAGAKDKLLLEVREEAEITFRPFDYGNSTLQAGTYSSLPFASFKGITSHARS